MDAHMLVAALVACSLMTLALVAIVMWQESRE